MKSLIALVATVLFIGTLLFVSIQSNYNSLKEIENSEIQLSKQSEQVDNKFDQIKFERDNSLVGLRGIYLGKKCSDTYIYKSTSNYYLRYFIKKDKNNRVYEVESQSFECNVGELNYLIDSLNNRYSIELENFVLPENPDNLFEQIYNVSKVDDNIWISISGNYYYYSEVCIIKIGFVDGQLFLNHTELENRKNK